MIIQLPMVQIQQIIMKLTVQLTQLLTQLLTQQQLFINAHNARQTVPSAPHLTTVTNVQDFSFYQRTSASNHVPPTLSTLSNL